MPVQPDLIFDIGVANGDDSAFYLRSGHRVIGVEANPLVIPKIQQRFRSEIADERYVLVPMAIGESAGEAPFWICDDEPEWSSLFHGNASAKGASHHQVIVQTCEFQSLLERFGTPLYCKIDIEGSEHLCLRDMTGDRRPPYLSVELSDGEAQIRQLAGLGYARFKIISQTSFRQPGRTIASLKRGLGPTAAKVLAAIELHAGAARSRGGIGPSGPFGEETHGRWLSAEDAIKLNRLLDPPKKSADWYDIHAALGDADRG